MLPWRQTGIARRRLAEGEELTQLPPKGRERFVICFPQPVPAFSDACVLVLTRRCSRINP
jgi:hypothetical protein